MDLWQQARGEFIDVIAWDEPGDDTLGGASRARAMRSSGVRS